MLFRVALFVPACCYLLLLCFKVFGRAALKFLRIRETWLGTWSRSRGGLLNNPTPTRAPVDAQETQRGATRRKHHTRKRQEG